MSDSIYSRPGETFYSELTGAASGLTGTAGVRIIDKSDETEVLSRRTTGIVESPSGSGRYVATLTAPVERGSYTVLWDTGEVSPSTIAADDLIVAFSAAAAVAPAGDLVSLEEVKGFLEISEEKEEDDEILTTFIGAIGRSFRNYTGREFLPTDDEERVFAHSGGRLLDVVPYDLRAVSELKTGVDTATPTTLAAADFRLRPLPARDGVFKWVRFACDPGECEVAIKGDWGFADVPVDVKHMALTQIALWLRRDVQAFERTFHLEASFLERPEALASAVRGALADYARVDLP